ncbi:MAG: carboxylesterase, partial [Ponticaulis sp.]|nr:carboxylesterase [Ponticaulis sp.]
TAYEGVNLANRGDVVVVTINHRLNALGYLYLAGMTDDPAYADSGNVGTLDMVHALKWVRDNIENFGGNPDNVTIFGESGGGRKVSVLNAMGMAEGLFDRAIVQSGSMLSFRTPEQAHKDTLDFFKAVEIEDGDIDALKALSQDEIIAGLRKAAAMSSRSFSWGPVVDGRSLKYDPFTAPDPQPNADVPMLIGSNKDELSLWLMRPGAGEPKLSFQAVKSLIGEFVTEDEFEDIVEAYRGEFPDYSDGQILVAMASDVRYSSNAVRQAKKKAEEGAAPVWLYQFDWETPVMDGIYKTPHALEIPFAFDTLENSESMVGDTKAPQGIADQVSEAWISFARHGDPNARGLPFWPTVTPDDVVAMRFNTVSEVDTDYFDVEGAILIDGE